MSTLGQLLVNTCTKKLTLSFLSKLTRSDFSHGFPWTFAISLNLYLCIKLKNLKFDVRHIKLFVKTSKTRPILLLNPYT